MAVILERDTLGPVVVRRVILLVFALGALAWPSSSPAAASPQELPPFTAIVPAITWTNLATALPRQGLSKSGLVSLLATAVPESRWDPELLAAKQSLISSTNMATVNALAASRSPISRLSSVTTPTLL